MNQSQNNYQRNFTSGSSNVNYAAKPLTTTDKQLLSPVEPFIDEKGEVQARGIPNFTVNYQQVDGSLAAHQNNQSSSLQKQGADLHQQFSYKLRPESPPDLKFSTSDKKMESQITENIQQNGYRTNLFSKASPYLAVAAQNSNSTQTGGGLFSSQLNQSFGVETNSSNFKQQTSEGFASTQSKQERQYQQDLNNPQFIIKQDLNHPQIIKQQWSHQNNQPSECIQVSDKQCLNVQTQFQSHNDPRRQNTTNQICSSQQNGVGGFVLANNNSMHGTEQQPFNLSTQMDTRSDGSGSDIQGYPSYSNGSRLFSNSWRLSTAVAGGVQNYQQTQNPSGNQQVQMVDRFSQHPINQINSVPVQAGFSTSAHNQYSQIVAANNTGEGQCKNNEQFSDSNSNISAGMLQNINTSNCNYQAHFENNSGVNVQSNLRIQNQQVSGPCQVTKKRSQQQLDRNSDNKRVVSHDTRSKFSKQPATFIQNGTSNSTGQLNIPFNGATNSGKKQFKAKTTSKHVIHLLNRRSCLNAQTHVGKSVPLVQQDQKKTDEEVESANSTRKANFQYLEGSNQNEMGSGINSFFNQLNINNDNNHQLGSTHPSISNNCLGFGNADEVMMGSGIQGVEGTDNTNNLKMYQVSVQDIDDQQQQKTQRDTSIDAQLILPQNPHKFKYDPDQGGGRTRRMKQVSRLEHIEGGAETLSSCAKNLFQSSGIQQPEQVCQKQFCNSRVPREGLLQNLNEQINQTQQQFQSLTFKETDMPFSTVKEEKLEESPATSNPNLNSATPSASTEQLDVIPIYDNQDNILGLSSSQLQPSDEPQFLPTIPYEQEPRNPVMNPISSNTLAQLMQSKKHQIQVIDCRFEYEFLGGHISGAVNISDPQTLEENLFNPEKLRQMINSRTILIFHCEFSIHRGPALWQNLRDMDRYLNVNRYPQLFFPESYLLEGGYQEFYSKYPHFCQNNSNGQGIYVPAESLNNQDQFSQMLATQKKVQKGYNPRARSDQLNVDHQMSVRKGAKQQRSTFPNNDQYPQQ